MGSKARKLYKIGLKPAARRQRQRFSKFLSRRTARDIGLAIADLAKDPFPDGVEKLKGKEGYQRIRIGDYRIIYLVLKKEKQIIVVRIAHRREAYKGL